MSNRNMKVAKVRGPRQNLRKLQQGGSKERSNNPAVGAKLYRRLPDMTKVIRAIRDFGTISTNGSGLLGVTNFYNAVVTANSNWSNISQEFQVYRVRRLVLALSPAYNKSAAHSGANDYPQSFLILGRWWEKVPTTQANLAQTDGMRTLPTYEFVSIETNFLGFKDAQLWTETGASIPSTQYYGMSITLPSGVQSLEPSSPVFNYCLEYEVEFQGMQ